MGRRLITDEACWYGSPPARGRHLEVACNQMSIVYDKLLALKIPDVEQSYGPKDCMLYALGVGLGLDPLDEDQLAFVYETKLKVLPTMAAVIGYPGLGVKERDTGIDWVKAVAGEYSLAL